jgi:hypothetical protein
MLLLNCETTSHFSAIAIHVNNTRATARSAMSSVRPAGESAGGDRDTRKRGKSPKTEEESPQPSKRLRPNFQASKGGKGGPECPSKRQDSVSFIDDEDALQWYHLGIDAKGLPRVASGGIHVTGVHENSSLKEIPFAGTMVQIKYNVDACLATLNEQSNVNAGQFPDPDQDSWYLTETEFKLQGMLTTVRKLLETPEEAGSGNEIQVYKDLDVLVEKTDDIQQLSRRFKPVGLT